MPFTQWRPPVLCQSPFPRCFPLPPGLQMILSTRSVSKRMFVIINKIIKPAVAALKSGFFVQIWTLPWLPAVAMLLTATVIPKGNTVRGCGWVAECIFPLENDLSSVTVYISCRVVKGTGGQA